MGATTSSSCDRREQPGSFAPALSRRRLGPAPSRQISDSDSDSDSDGDIGIAIGGCSSGSNDDGGDDYNYTVAGIHSALHAHLPAMLCDGKDCANAAEQLFVYFAGDGDNAFAGGLPIPPEILFFITQQFAGSWSEDTLPSLMAFLETNRLFRQILIDGRIKLRSFASMTFTLNTINRMTPPTATWNYPNRWLLTLGKVRFIFSSDQGTKGTRAMSAFHKLMDSARLLANLPNDKLAPYEVAFTFPGDFHYKGFAPGQRELLYSGGGGLVLNGNGKRHTVWKVTRVELTTSFYTCRRATSFRRRLWLPLPPEIANITDLVIVRAGMPHPRDLAFTDIGIHPSVRIMGRDGRIVSIYNGRGPFGHRIGAFWQIMPQLRVLKLDAAKERLVIPSDAWVVHSISVVPQMSRALYGISQGALAMSAVEAATAMFYKEAAPIRFDGSDEDSHLIDVLVAQSEPSYLQILAASALGITALQANLDTVIVAVGNRIDALLSAVSTPRVTPDGLAALNTLQLKAAAGLVIDEFMPVALGQVTRARMIEIFREPGALKGGQFLTLDHERPGFKAIAAGAGLARLEKLEVSGINVLVDNEFFGGGKRFSTTERVDTEAAVGRFRQWIADMALVVQQIQFRLTTEQARPVDASNLPIPRIYKEPFSALEEKLRDIEVQIEKDAAPATLPNDLREIIFRQQMVSNTFFQSLANGGGVVAATPLPRSRFHRLKQLTLTGIKTSRLDELFDEGGVFWNAVHTPNGATTAAAAVDMVTDSTAGAATFSRDTPLRIFANPLVRAAHLTDAALLCLANDPRESPIRQSRALANLEGLFLYVHPHFTAVGLTPVANASYPFLRRLSLGYIGHHQSKGNGPDVRQRDMGDGDRGVGKDLALPWAPLGEAVAAFVVRGATWALVRPGGPRAQRKESTLHNLSLIAINLANPAAAAAAAAPMDIVEVTAYWRTLLMLLPSVDIDSDSFRNAQERFVATMARPAALIAAHAAAAAAGGRDAYIGDKAVRDVIEGGRALRDAIADKPIQARDAIWEALKVSLYEVQREMIFLQGVVAPLVKHIAGTRGGGDDIDGLFERTEENARARDREDTAKTLRRMLAPAVESQIRELMLVGVRGLNDRPGIFYSLITTGITQPVLSNVTTIVLGGNISYSPIDLMEFNEAGDQTDKMTDLIVLSFMDFYALFISSGGLPSLRTLMMGRIGILKDELPLIIELLTDAPSLLGRTLPIMLPNAVDIQMGLFYTYTVSERGRMVFDLAHVGGEFARIFDER